MAQSTERQYEAGPLQPKTAPQHQSSPAKANPFKNFTVGDWSSEIWGDEVWDDIEASNEELYSSTPTIPTLTSMSRIDDEYSLTLEHEEIDMSHEIDEDMNQLMLKHKEAEKSSYDSNGDTSFSSSAGSVEGDSDSDTIATEPASESDDSDEKDRAQGVFYARRVLAWRAIDPPHSETVLPRRESFVVEPSGLRNQVAVAHISSC